jgi:hypothetical protein
MGPVERVATYTIDVFSSDTVYHLPNAYAIDDELVDDFNPNDWDIKTGLPEEKPASEVK